MEHMPIIKSAKKALRQTKKRTAHNKLKIANLRSLLANFKKQKNQKTLSSVYSSLDKLVKNKVIHKNKAKRIKSRLALSLNKNSKSEVKKTPTKKNQKRSLAKK